MGTVWDGKWPLKKEKELKDKEVWNFPGESQFYQYVATNNKFNDIEIEIKDAPTVDSLQQLLLDMLTYTYNYNKNFDGASLLSTPNKMDILRAKFENQKPEDVITNLFKQWKLDYPNYIDLEQVKIFKQIVIMLSNNIYSSMSINKGLNDDNKILLPYYFFNYVEKYGWPKIIHQFTLKILFLIKNLLKVTLFSLKIL
ncbi:hypothetical protein [Spiroplasma endosymbiont of Amphimallon solstitiale]|uniref:hypothetical protein n=1 Tax=Spiroplasma endosymbiont of Amphimallon solstitiale TaxID=3066288 RepID=UPI00313B2BCD